MSKKGGHHGGAWKVAYADFVTAMMALFMVLWLAAQDQKIKEAVARAFRHPFMSLTHRGAGLVKNQAFPAGTPDGQDGNISPPIKQQSLVRLAKLKSALHNAMALPQEKIHDETVDVQATKEGLKIEIFDRARDPVFEKDSAKFTKYGTFILQTLAWKIIENEQYELELEGHTELKYASTTNFNGNWRLSSDRAIAGLALLVESGVAEKQIRKVAGFSDRNPLPYIQPDDPANRRITLLLRLNQ